MDSHKLVLYWLVALTSLAVVAPVRSIAGEPNNLEREEQAIRATTKAYLAAMERGNATELAEFWIEGGDFVDEMGNSHPARELIGKRSDAAQTGERDQINITGTSIRLLTLDVAIEDGTSEVIHPASHGLPPSRGRFAAIWVKQEGKWKLASLREARVEPVSTPAQLEELDWMTGTWEARNDQNTIEISAVWNSTRTFLSRELRIHSDGRLAFNTVQRIGWDPIARKIKSWNFDSDGGYGEGFWTKVGNSWIVNAVGVRHDGSKTSSTNVYKFDQKNSFTWQSTSTRSGTESSPELKVEFTRKPGEQHGNASK